MAPGSMAVKEEFARIIEKAIRIRDKDSRKQEDRKREEKEEKKKIEEDKIIKAEEQKQETINKMGKGKGRNARRRKKQANANENQETNVTRGEDGDLLKIEQMEKIETMEKSKLVEEIKLMEGALEKRREKLQKKQNSIKIKKTRKLKNCVNF